MSIFAKKFSIVVEGSKYNPLVLMFRDVLQDHIRTGHEFFVRQTFERGRINPHVKEAVLITPYKTFAEAKAHMDIIRFDKRKLIYSIGDAWQKSQLFKAAAQPEGYLVFMAKIENSFYGPGKPIAGELQQFIQLFTDWRPERISDVEVSLFVRYGKIFVQLNYNEQRHTVLLDVLDHMWGVIS